MDESRSSAPEIRRLAIILITASALFFLRLDCALLEPEEARYAEIAREMLNAGEWLVPLLHGQPYLDKPPLLHWLVMSAYSLFGVHDWAARLVPGACGLLTVLTTYLWGRRVFNPQVAFFSALTLTLTSRFIYLGRFVATDTVLNLCVVAALACLHIALTRSRRRWPWWSAGGFACGLGLLAKGPIALLLVGMPVGAFLVLNRRTAWPGLLETALFLTAMALTAGPWYAFVLTEPGFARYFFWQQHVQRFVAPFDHAKPFWFYLPDLVAGTLPWALLLLPLVGWLWGTRGDLLRRQAPDVLLPLLAAVSCLLFFSASGCKRVGYVLPVFAPLALAIGFETNRLLSAADRFAAKWLRALPALGATLVGLGGLALTLFSYWPVAVGVSLLTTMLALSAWLFIRQESWSPRRGWQATVVMGVGVSLFGVGWVLPRYHERFSLREQILAMRERAPAETAVVCYPRGWDSVNYYLRRDDVPVFSVAERQELRAFLCNHDETALFLRDPHAGAWLFEDLPPTLAVEIIAQQSGHFAVRVSRPDRREALASRGLSP
jgi:4-amino-4-deoxy-L-arabinose transferase-like glycosyltransferase